MIGFSPSTFRRPLRHQPAHLCATEGRAQRFHDMAKPGSWRARILRPFPYEDRGGKPMVAPVGAYEMAEVGEHFQFSGEGVNPFEMPRKHALMHHKYGHLEIEDWLS
jgi:hypothetical protein